MRKFCVILGGVEPIVREWQRLSRMTSKLGFKNSCPPPPTVLIQKISGKDASLMLKYESIKSVL